MKVEAYGTCRVYDRRPYSFFFLLSLGAHFFTWRRECPRRTVQWRPADWPRCMRAYKRARLSVGALADWVLTQPPPRSPRRRSWAAPSPRTPSPRRARRTESLRAPLQVEFGLPHSPGRKRESASERESERERERACARARERERERKRGGWEALFTLSGPVAQVPLRWGTGTRGLGQLSSR